jgi:hypothetical protein
MVYKIPTMTLDAIVNIAHKISSLPLSLHINKMPNSNDTALLSLAEYYISTLTDCKYVSFDDNLLFKKRDDNKCEYIYYASPWKTYMMNDSLIDISPGKTYKIQHDVPSELLVLLGEAMKHQGLSMRYKKERMH